MTKETVKSIVQQLADGKIDAAEAGRRIGPLVTRRPVVESEAERMKRYYDSYHDAGGPETDPNSFNHVSFLYHSGEITKAQLETLSEAMHANLEKGTKLSAPGSDGIEYYLTENSHPVRKFGDGDVEMFTADGTWIASDGQGLTPCTEAEALAAAKKVMAV